MIHQMPAIPNAVMALTVKHRFDIYFPEWYHITLMPLTFLHWALPDKVTILFFARFFHTFSHLVAAEIPSCDETIYKRNVMYNVKNCPQIELIHSFLKCNESVTLKGYQKMHEFALVTLPNCKQFSIRISFSIQSLKQNY